MINSILPSVVLWLVYFVLELKLLNKISRFLFLSFLFLLISIVIYITSFNKFFSIPFIISVMFFHFHLLRDYDSSIRFLALVWYISIVGFEIVAIFEFINIDFLVFISILSLLVRGYKSLGQLVFWLVLVILAAGFTYTDYRLLFLFYSILLVPHFFEQIDKFLIQKEKDLSEYRKLVDRAINTEVQKRINEIDDRLSITTKKLKEIFKLSNYTVSTPDLDAMTDRVVDGLLNLGYTGVVISINIKNIFKKGGYFPNYKTLIEYDIETFKNIYINEEHRYILLNLKVGKEALGFLAVYKKDGALPKEAEYLSTYANSVAIAVANIIHFEELINLQELTYKVFESLDIGIAVLNDKLEIDMVNNAFLDITGNYNFHNKKVFELLPEVYHLSKDLQYVLNERKNFETEFASLVNRGKIYRIKVLPLYIETLESSKLILIIEDITEKENLENQIIETEKLAVIGKMAAGLSHDIKTPLTIISGAAYRIKQKSKQDENIKNLAIKIEEQSARARNIIDRLLNYSKPSYWNLQKLNLKDIIRQSIEFTNHYLKGKNIKIKTNLRKNVYVEADQTALQQVFTNLIINSIEAIKIEGTIEISIDKEDGYAVVNIEDTGVGISETNIEKIFDPFFTTKEKGTGLGLAVVSRIIKDHRGYIKAYSRENQGTKFVIKIPLTEEPDER